MNLNNNQISINKTSVKLRLSLGYINNIMQLSKIFINI